MPTRNLFVEYQDHEPSERGQPSISLSIRFPIGTSGCHVTIDIGPREVGEQDTLHVAGDNLNVVRRIVEKMLAVCVIQDSGIGGLHDISTKKLTALIRAAIAIRPPFMTISVLGPGISSGVDDTDLAIHRQIAKYLNAGFKDTQTEKFKLISTFLELEYISSAMQQNRQ